MHRRAVLTLLGTAALAGCSRKASIGASGGMCADSGIAGSESMSRTVLAYSDVSSDPNQTCDLCAQFVPAASGCGTCKVVEGPIHPKGRCRVFAAKT